MHDDLMKLTVDISQNIDVAAAIGDVYKSLLAQLTTDFATPDNKSIPMVLEQWPGGRWFRDLGPGQGHLWGFVQVIKPPALLEIHGPLFMSFAATSHIQFRLTPASGGAVAGGTVIALRHRALGMIEDDLRQGMAAGWAAWLKAVKGRCE
jgi:hypothetical protein